MSDKGKDGDVSGETKEFDASAFTSNGIVDSAEGSAEENNSNESGDSDNSNESGDSGDAGESGGEDNSSDNESGNENEDFSWTDDNTGGGENYTDDNEGADNNDNDDSNDSDSDDNSNDADDSGEGDGSNDNSDANGEDNNSPVVFDGSLTDEHFTAFASELGINAKTLPEFKKALEELENENKKLKESSPGVTNDKITKYNEFLKLGNEELLRKDLAAQGFRDDKLDNAIDTLKDNQMLDIEATKVRNAINGAITTEQQSITQKTLNEDAKHQEDRDKSVKELQTYLNNQNEMFGFKMAKDENSLSKVRDNHQKYITSGSYLKDITKDNESLAESAWLWKNRETLLKAARNNGLQQGRSEVLDDIGQPDNGGSGTFADPSGKGEFDASKFGAPSKD